MSDAPAMPALSKAVNAALIGCTAWLERPALIVNKIKALVRVKINENISCVYATACVLYWQMSDPSKVAPTMQMNTKSQKLIDLKAKWDAVKDDYKNAERMQVCTDYHAEMKVCGRRYFDDRIEAFAQDHGCLYGEDTMLNMIADGTFDMDDLNASVQKHCAGILRADAEMKISEQGHE